MHFVVIVVVTPLTSLRAFFAPLSRRVLPRHGRGLHRVGQLLRPCERGGIRGRLQGALRVVDIADVDHERRHPEQDDERDHDEHDRLAALGRKPLRRRTTGDFASTEPPWSGSRRQAPSRAVNASTEVIDRERRTLASPNG